MHPIAQFRITLKHASDCSTSSYKKKFDTMKLYKLCGCFEFSRPHSTVYEV